MHKLTLGVRQIDLSTPVCMGIVNVTPDSFSDGSQFSKKKSPNQFDVDVAKVLQTVASMVAEGAQFIDVGGESTRPGASPVSVAQELGRVIPVIEAVRKNFDICISVDTSSPEVMRAAISAGAELVNDVRALTRKNAIATVAATNAGACLMHMQGKPVSMQEKTVYSNLLEEVFEFLEVRVNACIDGGIERSRLLVDPGFGFGKSVEHNFQLLKHLTKFCSLGLPVLVGISRKSMIGGVTNRPVDQRLPGSIAATMVALSGGAKIVRTHDVAATMDAIRVHCALQNA
jgi:dihydropteroate synthase